MKAILTTLCGCQREFNVTFPPSKSIVIPLNQRECNRGWLEIPPEDPDDVFKTRKFVLDNSIPFPYNPKQTAYYIEQE